MLSYVILKRGTLVILPFGANMLMTVGNFAFWGKYADDNR